MQGPSSGRVQPSNPQGSQSINKRPGAVKRTTSIAAPHRGDKFSTDDDPIEVGDDLRLYRTVSRQDQYRDRPQVRRREGTLRRRQPGPAPNLPRVESDEQDGPGHTTGNDIAATASRSTDHGEPSSEETLQGEEEEEEEPTSPEDDDVDLSDSESFTLKDRQEAINETHPFGIRIWKPALYKKDRSVQRNAEGDIHSAPGGNVTRWIWVFNGLWTIIFGWWLSLIAFVGGLVCVTFGTLPGSSGCRDYGRVLINLSHYLLYPFGKYIRLEREEAYIDEDEGLGRAVSEYERWQAGDLEEGRLFFGPEDMERSIIGRRREEIPDLEESENDSLLSRQPKRKPTGQRTKSKAKKRLFGRGKWNLGRVIFFISFYCIITPCLFVVSAVCWFLVFTIPMGKVTLLLFYHLRRHPLAMSFHTDSHYARIPTLPQGDNDSVILLCTYRAVGLKYWKYTIDGTNIFLINLLGLVVFTIFDYYVLDEALGVKSWITANGFVFVLALASIIPLAYFIGQAVASISAQSSMGVGATINAFFSTVVEVFLYCVALQQGKNQLVEGSIIGSIFAGILFLPGLSMCFGALKRKTQRFNVKSAGVTTTMLLFAVIGLFGPTLFYQMHGSHILNCRQCITPSAGNEVEKDCRRCYFSQIPELNDRFYIEAVRPYSWVAAICLFLSYAIGLLFTLRTHAAVIWHNEPDEKKDTKEQSPLQQQVSMPGTAGLVNPDSNLSGGVTKQPTHKPEHTGTLRREDIRESQMYKRILNQSLKLAGIQGSQISVSKRASVDDGTPKAEVHTPHIVPPKSSGDDGTGASSGRLWGLSPEDSRALLQQVAEIAATAATVAARDATRAPRQTSLMATTSGTQSNGKLAAGGKDTREVPAAHPHDRDLPPDASIVHEDSSGGHGGHDAPNWSRKKSVIVLLVATLAYAVIAEILVDTVDAVLSHVGVDEKFLGILLFALVPNTTEFLNAISFAVYGNVALSMEIGSSYALQVMLLQTPCLVLFSAIYIKFLPPEDVLSHTFTLLFPSWDMVTVILGVFLMGWVVGEGKSNYFKGSILIFSYLVVIVGFWFSSYSNEEVSSENVLTLPDFTWYSHADIFSLTGYGY